MDDGERNRLIQERERKQREKRQYEQRKLNKKSIDELLSKILNGDLFDIYNINNLKFPKIPNRFTNHVEYMQIWEYLFSYEVYNTMQNSRRADSKNENPLGAGLEAKSSLQPTKK